MAPTGVECHRRGSSVVRRPVKILCSSRSRGTSPVEKIEGSLGQSAQCRAEAGQTENRPDFGNFLLAIKGSSTR